MSQFGLQIWFHPVRNQIHYVSQTFEVIRGHQISLNFIDAIKCHRSAKVAFYSQSHTFLYKNLNYNAWAYTSNLNLPSLILRNQPSLFNRFMFGRWNKLLIYLLSWKNSVYCFWVHHWLHFGVFGSF